MRPLGTPHQDAASDLKQERAQFARLALDNLFEITPDAILATDTEGIIRAANARSEEIFGHTRAELMGQPVEILIPERYRSAHPSHRAGYNAHPKRRPMGAGLKLFGLRKDGSEFPVDIMLTPVETPEGSMVLIFIRDETERRNAEEERRRADEQLHAIVGSLSNHAIYMLDPRGRVLSWNPGAELIKGYSAAEVIGQYYGMFFAREDVEQDKPAELLRLAAKEGRVELEGWRVRKSGERFWANVVLTAIRDKDGEIAGFSKVVQDFTERKKATDAILLQMSSALLVHQDADSLLEAISASLRDLIAHDCATMGLLNETRDQIQVRFLSQSESGMQYGTVSIPLAGTPAEEVHRTGTPILLPDLSARKYAPGSLKHLTSIGMRSACCVPLNYAGVPLGSMAVASRNLNGFTAKEAQILMEAGRQVSVSVHNARQLRQLVDVREKLDQQRRYLEEEINLENQFEDIVGESTGLRQVLQQIETVAPTNATVLIEGETGTGKELLARAIHRLSKREKSTFVKLNCAAIPSGLIESELFGHEKGAFTGAIQRKVGKLELAHEGTLFLDEIGELPLELQPKLLRALQEREIERLGSNRPISVDVRLIAATNRNLEQMVAEGKFRGDLYYRLKVFPVFAPSLRERASDIPALVRHFVTMHSRRMGKNIESIPAEAMRALLQCKWPGNIRELENFVERSVILTRGKELYVPFTDLRAEVENPEKPGDLLVANERDHIVRVLRETGGRIGGENGAAVRLGLKRTTLNSKMRRLKIRKSDYISP